MVASRVLVLLAAALCSVQGTDVPSQIHMALGRTPSQMTLSWATTHDTYASHLIYGRDPWQLTLTAPAKPTSYTMHSVPRTESKFVTYTSPTIYHAALDGLTPSTTYYFQCISGNNGSPIGKFRTAPARGSSEMLRMLVVGDLGQTVDSNSTVGHMIQQSEDASVVLHAGDMSYGNNT